MRVFGECRTGTGKPLEQQAAPDTARKAARAGPADEKVEDWLATRMDQLLCLAAKQDRRATDRLGLRRRPSGIAARRQCVGISLTDKGVRALRRLDIALARQPAK